MISPQSVPILFKIFKLCSCSYEHFFPLKWALISSPTFENIREIEQTKSTTRQMQTFRNTKVRSPPHSHQTLLLLPPDKKTTGPSLTFIWSQFSLPTILNISFMLQTKSLGWFCPCTWGNTQNWGHIHHLLRSPG